MKKKKIVVSMLVVCLLCVNMLSMAVRAETTPTVHVVSDWYDFKDAVQYSQDGDIIVVYGVVDLGDAVKIGSSSKHLTIERGSADGYIIFGYTHEEVMNTTFDGGGIISSYSWITSQHETTFTNCAFKNFGSKENLSSSGCVGGAVEVQSGSCVFNACIFENCYALEGGAINIDGDAQVEINDCIIKNGGAVSCGGAVYNSSYAATCTISGSEITGNTAHDFGGGVSNAGNMTIIDTKIYANSAVNGGADVATKVSGVTTLKDTVEQLNELFSSDNIEVNGWVCDYDFDENIYIPDVTPTNENALLKLDYSKKQPETPDPTDPTDPVEPSEPSEPSTEPSTPTDPEKPGETEPGTEPSETPEPTKPGKEEPDDKTEPSKSDNVTNTDNSSTNTSTVSSGDTVNSTTTNTTTDNSKVNSTGDTSTTTTTNTTNNYYQTATGDTSQPVIQDSTPQHENNTYIVYPNSNEVAASSAGMDETVKISDPVQNLNIDAKGVDCKIEVVDGKYNISINAEQQQTAVNDSIKDNSMDWLQIIQVVLLVAILICLVRKPKER